MRFCILCQKAMYTSINNIWIAKKNYDIHKKCEPNCASKMLCLRKMIAKHSQNTSRSK